MPMRRDRLVALLERHGIPVVLDVGAHQGEFANDLFSSAFSGAIYSFEAQPRAWAELVNRARGERRGRWRVAERAAVGDRDGEATFYEAGNSVSSSLLPMADAHVEAAPESGTVGRFTVPTKPLDAIIPQIIAAEGSDRLFLKIDVQGAEHLVLAGARQALATSIRAVQIEMSLETLYEGQWPAERLHQFLVERGFVLWDIIPFFRHPMTMRLLQYDGVYLRPEPA